MVDLDFTFSTDFSNGKTLNRENRTLEYNMNEHFEQRFRFITAIDMVCFTALISVAVVKTWGRQTENKKIKGGGRGRDMLCKWRSKAKELN